MARILYKSKKFGLDARHMIATANRILEDYARQGYDLTLRQLYYQLVARDLFPDDRTWTQDPRTRKWFRDLNGTKNAEPNYKWLGDLVNDARLAGYIDWDYIVDRTRNLQSLTHWRDPAHIIGATARSYKNNLWADQENYVEVWIEKDALVGVIEGICSELDVPFFSCRGYTSQSEMWAASQRLLVPVKAGKHVTIVHLGDHDPSGIDMTRDIEDRLTKFIGMDYVRDSAEADNVALVGDVREYVDQKWYEAVARFEVDRIALTMDQVVQYGPPPNPAKVTDSRAAGYIRDYGNESWELDALDPPTLSALIREAVESRIDSAKWDQAVARELEGQKLLERASDDWELIVESLNGTDDTDDTEEDEDEEDH